MATYLNVKTFRVTKDADRSHAVIPVIDFVVSGLVFSKELTIYALLFSVVQFKKFTFLVLNSIENE